MLAAGPIEGTEGFDRLVPKDQANQLKPERKIPVQRFGTKDDIANATVFLCSPAASYVSSGLCVLVCPVVSISFLTYIVHGCLMTLVS